MDAQASPLRRLMVIHYPFFGGPHNQALRLDAPLRRLGVETTVVLPDEPGNAAERLRGAGVDVVTMPLSRLRAKPSPVTQARFVGALARDVARLRALIRDRNVDVVEINGLVNPHGALAASREHVPIVWQLLDTRSPTILRRAMMPLVTRLSGAVMSTGVEVARVHPGAMRLGDQLVPFFPPVDTELFRPDAERRAAARRQLGISDDELVVGTVANLTPQKGLETWLAAAEQIAQRADRTTFVLLGRRMESHVAYEQRVRERAAETGLVSAGRLILDDPGSRVHELLPAFDIFLTTPEPRSEGISTTVLEAMATGLPVITTDVGALSEAVIDQATGFVVGDASLVTGRVLALIEDRDKRAAMGARARERATETFDLETCASTHLRAIEIARSRG